MKENSKKLIVYLDQNLLSDIAKIDNPEKEIRSEVKKIFELLKKGFQEEKLVVPRSWFHKEESCLKPELKRPIRECQGFVGQVALHPMEDIYSFQIDRARNIFLGEEENFIYREDGFRKNPDKRVEQFDIDVDIELEKWHSVERRDILAGEIEKIREEDNVMSYEEERKRIVNLYRNLFLEHLGEYYKRFFNGSLDRVEEFVYSECFAKIPVIDIGSRMWAAILTNKGREIQRGDKTDVEIISTALPYTDVIVTDAFMSHLIKRLDLNKKYSLSVFSSKTQDLKKLIDFLEEKIKTIKPVNKPDVSIFVLPDSHIKDNSFDFFKKLGSQSSSIYSRKGKWVEVYGFNDGSMPNYIHENSGAEMDFYGLQDVTPIKIEKDTDIKEIIRLCKEHSRSDKFILIDSYRCLPDNFIDTLNIYCKNEKDKILNYTIYNVDQ